MPLKRRQMTRKPEKLADTIFEEFKSILHSGLAVIDVWNSLTKIVIRFCYLPHPLS
jgi:hypothetical protein